MFKNYLILTLLITLLNSLTIHAVRDKIELLSKPETAALYAVIATLKSQIQELRSNPDPVKQRQLAVFETHLKTCQNKLATNSVLTLHYDGVLSITKAQRRQLEETLRPKPPVDPTNRPSPCRCLRTTASNIYQAGKRLLR